jgi:small subunit ribosomal protein S16
VGKKKQPSYRVVVAESSAPRDGRFVEVIGFYNPRTEPETIKLKEARVLYWLGVGAQPSESVKRILNTTGTWERFARQKAGEPLEALVAEAEEAAEKMSEISPKTKPAVREAEATPEAAEEAEAPSVEEAEAPSAGEAEVPSAEEAEAPSAEEAEAPPAEEAEASSAEETEVPPVEEEEE